MSEPEMIGWSRPLLPLAAEHLVEAHAAKGVTDMRDSVVVVPGGRAGRRLKEVLVDAARDRGLRLVPPRIVGFGRLPELLYDSSVQLAPPIVRRRAWDRALEEVSPEKLEKLFGRSVDDADEPALAELASDLERLHREVGAGGHRFEDVAATCRERAGELKADDSPRWSALADLQRRYAELLARAGFADPDLSRVTAVVEKRVQAPGDVWLVGIPELPRVTETMLEQVAERVRPLVHAPESERHRFGPLGTIVPDQWGGPDGAHAELDEDRVVFVDGPSDQADEVVRQIAAHAATDAAGGRGELAPDDISIGVPDTSLVPWLAEALETVGVHIRDARGRGVHRTAPFRALEAVAEYVRGRRFEAFAALVRHPDVEAWIGSVEDGEELVPDWLHHIDRWYGASLPARMPAPGGSPSGVRGADAVATVLLRLDEGLLGSVAEPDRRRRADWANSFVDVLERLYGRRALDSGRRSDRTLARALSAVAVACRSLADLPPELDGDVSAASALRDALRLAAGGRIGAEPESDAIEALGWLELHPDDAPLKILTGANEPFLPEAVRGDPFLPDALRGMLGLVDDRTRLARDVYRLQAMARSTPCLVVVAGRRTDQNDPLRPSRLLFAAEPDTVVERVHRFFDATRADAVSDADAGEDGGPSPSRRGSAAGGFSVPPVPRLHAERILDRVRVTDFSRLLADPYRFALLREVAGDSVRDDARELDPMQFGNVVHEVLDELGKEDTIHSADVDVLVERLDSLLYTSYQRRYRSGAQVPHVSVRIQREQIRSRLHAFAAWHAGRVEEGWEVVGTEVGTQEGGIPLDVDGRSIRVTGKIDRIERHAETGAYAVFDYKTAGTFKTPEQHHRTRGRWVDLQLPLYRWMLPRLRDDEGAARFPDAVDVPIAVGFVNLCRTLSKIGSVEAAWSDEEHADALETARAAVRDMRGEGFGWDPSRTPPYPNDEVERILGKGVLVPIETGDDA